jgi:hypothetical protein
MALNDQEHSLVPGYFWNKRKGEARRARLAAAEASHQKRGRKAGVRKRRKATK